MKRLSAVVVVLAFAAALAVAPGCQKAEEAKTEVKSAPKATTPATPKPQQSSSQVQKETLDSCIKRNPDNTDYCNCYAKEVGERYAQKAKEGDVSPQERGQIAVQSALACKKSK